MASKFEFKHHLIDTELPPGLYAQTALVDLDNDGRLEYVVGQRYGDIYWYKSHAPDTWSRHLLGDDSPSDVGGCAFDVDGDGWADFVAGGAWYRNSRGPDKPFERFSFDADLTGVHDVRAADLDGDGALDVITMSDQNNLRWYKIPADPTQLWIRHDIGTPVHAGVSVGDVNGSGHLDIVRTNVWFENVKGDGTQWVENPIAPNTPPPPDFQPYFAFDATYSVVCDMNGNGWNDIVFTDAEIPGGTIWWMENVHGTGLAWRRHEIAGGFSDVDGGKARRGAYHSLYVGDLDGDGDFDVFSCEMEAVGGERPPRYYIWENLDGVGGEWQEHVILDANLGGHAALVGDVTGNGLADIIAKPWNAQPTNALGGKMFVVLLENVSG
jgi:hypothetical protein